MGLSNSSPEDHADEEPRRNSGRRGRGRRQADYTQQYEYVYPTGNYTPEGHVYETYEEPPRTSGRREKGRGQVDRTQQYEYVYQSTNYTTNDSTFKRKKNYRKPAAPGAYQGSSSQPPAPANPKPAQKPKAVPKVARASRSLTRENANKNSVASSSHQEQAQKPKAALNVARVSRSTIRDSSSHSENNVFGQGRREPSDTRSTSSSGQNKNTPPARFEPLMQRPVQAVVPTTTFLASASGLTPLSYVNVGVPNQLTTGSWQSGVQLSGGPCKPLQHNTHVENNSNFSAVASGSASGPMSQQGSRGQGNFQKRHLDVEKVDHDVRQKKVITKNQLDILSGKSDREILFQIQNFSTGFLNLLRETNYPDDVLVLVMDILAKVCRNEDCPHTANALLQTVLYTKLFSDRMVRYLQTAACDSVLLKNLLIVFTTVLREFKAEAECKVGKCLVLCKHAITQQIQPSAGLADEFIRELYCLTDVQKANKESSSINVVSKEYPSVCDISYDPPSEAKPQTSKDYKLRLLNSLRKAFIDTLKLDPENSKIQKVDMYSNVHIIATDFTWEEGFVHKLSFDTPDLDVPRTSSTKLLEGSTVLLAPGLLEELHCAVVARCPEELAQGQVWVKLLNHKSTVLQHTGQLTMVENFTYQHDFISLMSSLSIQLEHPLPFETHILGMKKKVAHPIYLDSKSVIQFPFLKKNSTPSGKQINALNTITWPSAKSFGHNDQEHDAFKHALTKSLALVHCPCWTNNVTFGANVLHTILHNEAHWPQLKTPVLVLFNSVKALDSFLRKILAALPEEKVVRIGGECKDVALMSYNLHETRRILCSADAIPLYVVQNQRILMEKMRKLKADIVFMKEVLEKSRVSILKSDALRPHIAETNWKKMISILPIATKDEPDPLVKWLTVCAPNSLKCWKTNQASILGSRNVGKDSQLSKIDAGVNFDDSLAQTEMDRRVSSFLSPHFLDMENNFRQKSAAQTADNLFVEPQDLNIGSSHLIRGNQHNLSDIVAAELNIEDITGYPSEDTFNELINNIGALQMKDRWRLYRHWRSKWQLSIKEELLKLQGKYEKAFLQLQEIVAEIDVSILQRSRVVGATTTAAAKYHRVLKMLAPRIIIVEEAGQISESSVIAALTEHCCHLIMIGDHQQLKPKLNGFRSSDNVNPPGTISLFEKLIENGIEPARITAKHTVSSLMQNVTNSLFTNSVVNVSASHDTSSNVRGMTSDIFFINSSSSESVSESSPDSFINEYEANYLTLLSRYLVGRGHAQSQITILASCIGQVHLLKQICVKSNLDQIECSSVEDFQGNSNDIILLSLVRSNGRGDLGCIADENFMFVALTRARLGLYCIGNFKMLVDSSDAWKTRITHLAVQHLYGSALSLKCNRHPTVSLRIDSCSILQNALQGVCMQTCLAVMPCGHQCLKTCHDDDVDHREVRCALPCQKTVCPEGHRCLRKCFEECPPCEQSVWKEYPCGHDTLLKCSESQVEKPCQEKCSKPLSCGHECPKICGQECDDSACIEIVEYEGPCKHSFSIPCNSRTLRNADKLCPSPCNAELQCGHNCSGTCGQCKQGRMHVPCKAKCVCVLICGHKCQELCGSNCLPCKQACDNRCDHGQCTSGCGAPCVPCLEPCTWQCAHVTCQNLCFEPCDRMPCNLPCPRKLTCGHPCVGFCGESCPSLCRICNRSELLEGMFGSQEDASCRFVLLEDCGHVVAASIMDMLVKRYGTIEVITCPICSVPVRNCFRYGNCIKAAIFDVGKIVVQCNQEENWFKDLRYSVLALPQEALSEVVQQLQTEIQRRLNRFETMVLKNKYQFLVCMLKLWHDSHGLVSDPDRLEVHRVLSLLEEWHMDLNPASGQTAIDAFVRELKRAMYLLRLYKTFQDQVAPSSSQKILFGYLRKRLSDGKVFSSEDEKVVVDNMKRLFSTWNGVFKEEDITDVRGFDVLQMTAGHWTKCANGHFCFSREYSSGQQVHCEICAEVAGQ